MARWEKSRRSEFYDERRAVEGSYTLVIIGDPAGDFGGVAGFYDWYVECGGSTVAKGQVKNCKPGEAMLKAEIAMAEHARSLAEEKGARSHFSGA